MGQSRVVAKINIKNLMDNIDNIYSHMPVPKPIMAVIKANGYGHGSVRLANSLEKSNKIYGFAVATADEALELRQSGITKPILILGYVFEEDYEELIINNVIVTVFDTTSAKNLSDTAEALNMKAKVHIKVDTGMSRIGVPVDDTGLKTVTEICKNNALEIDGIFTHFARADECNTEAAYVQLNKFIDFVQSLKDIGINIPNVHCANSAGILQIPESHISFVRAGIIIYGLWPSDDMLSVSIELKPVMSIHSHVVHIKEVKCNTPVSYGGTFVTNQNTVIATIPVGYADGYPRSLSNKGYVLINGQRASIVGRVCMDQMMVDVTGLDVKVLDEVVLLGQCGDETITAESLGDISGRFNYELVCDITSRVPRIYI